MAARTSIPVVASGRLEVGNERFADSEIDRLPRYDSIQSLSLEMRLYLVREKRR